MNKLKQAELEAFKSRDWQINKYHNLSGITTDALIGRVKTHIVKHIQIKIWQEVDKDTSLQKQHIKFDIRNSGGKTYLVTTI